MKIKIAKMWLYAVGLLVSLTLIITLTTGVGATTIVYVGEDSAVVGIYGRDYQYMNSFPGANWFSNSFDHSSWAVGETVFGNTSGIQTVPTRTSWPVNTHMYIFKTFTLGQPIDMIAKTAVDNGYTLYINDNLVNSQNAEGFTFHWEYTDNVGKALFQSGLNWLAVDLEDHGGSTGWDFALLGDDKGLLPVPLPSALLLLSSGLCGLAALRPGGFKK
jgi:hypothetical protein